jgi:hypothetical protein
VNFTIVPLVGAGPLKVTVPVGEAGPTIEDGEIWKVLTLGAPVVVPPVIVNVTGCEEPLLSEGLTTFTLIVPG